MWKHVISITGNTATGTTTLARRFQQLVGWQAVYSEDYLIRSPFFTNFLDKPKRWAFHNQVYFYAEYIDDYQVVTQPAEPKNQVLCLDYTVFELVVYTDAMKEEGFLEPDEYKVLSKLLKLFQPTWFIPDLIIYLTAPVDILMKRIQQRGRAAETNLDRNYLIKLQREFDRLIESWSEGPVLIIESETYNFRDDDAVVKFISAQALSQIAQYRLDNDLIP